MLVLFSSLIHSLPTMEEIEVRRLFFYLIPLPLLPGEKGSKYVVNTWLSPSPLGEGFRVRLIFL